MNFEIRPLLEDQVPAFRQAVSAGFGHDADLEDEAAAARFEAVFDRDRCFPVFEGEDIVGTGGDFELTVTVPGGAQVPMSGLTIITVRPTHTRRGVLTAMMRAHVDQAYDRGEPLGGLWASEATIYGRFGYGQATLMQGVKFDARLAGRGATEPGVKVRIVGGEQAEAMLPPLYDQVQGSRPGMYQRSPNWWKHRLLYDPEKGRDGASALRHAIAERDGEPIGYMTYRQKSSWDLLSEGEVRIRELIPTSDAAYRALWHYASNIDLFPIVKHWNNPVEDALPLILGDGRAVATTDYSDALWIRLIDVAAALRQRSYAETGSLVIEVADSFCEWNHGSYRLTVTDGTATCDPVTATADVAMSVDTLGALYMGGRHPGSFAQAGRIQGDNESIERLGRMFRSATAPWCAEIF